MLVFRKPVTTLSASALRSDIAARLDLVQERPGRATLLPLLLRAGELETALEDATSPCAPESRRFTDALADAFVAGESGAGSRQSLGQAAPRARRWLASAPLPEVLTLRRPEGYAFYALDPAGYARAARAMSFVGPRATVVGVRSIGASLSAVVAAVLRQRGLDVARTTVRPHGHPWNRQLSASDPALEPCRQGRGGEVLVVDEGPGLSGSTFLAVAEAAMAAGVPAREIRLLCSHRPDLALLRAPDAPRRWERFRATPVEGGAVPAGWTDLSAGQWRSKTHGQERAWPACWTQRERVKFLSPDGAELRKFVGFAPYGERAAAAAGVLADAGFAPAVVGMTDGFLSLRWRDGRCFGDGDPAPVGRMAEYLAFRARHFRAGDAAASPDELRDMVEANVAEATGASLPRGLRFQVVAPVIPDGRLLPHEWLGTPEGDVLKVDGHDHGDDHLWPGPCDVAWDLAGAVVEWELAPREVEHLLEAYRFRTNDDVRGRLGPYLVGYAAFRLGCVHLAQGETTPDERERFAPLESRYRRVLQERLATLH